MSAASSARAEDAKETKTGSFQITISQRSKESAIPLIVSRLGWGTMDSVKKSGAEQDYDLKNETFEVYVPATYTGQEAYGLFVWVNAGDNGGTPERWRDVLDKHRLIWVGANHSGNQRAGWVRLGLALDIDLDIHMDLIAHAAPLVRCRQDFTTKRIRVRTFGCYLNFSSGHLA